MSSISTPPGNMVFATPDSITGGPLGLRKLTLNDLPALPPGGITSITTSGPITGGPITTSGTIGFDYTYAGTFTNAIWNGTAITDAYISSATTWNAKQNALSGTGIVMSGSGIISYILGTSFQFVKGDGSLDGSSYITTAITSLNALTASVQTFQTGTSGTDFTISSSGTVHKFLIPSSSASARGLLTSTDWSNFNSKEPAITSGTTSQYWRGDKTWQTFPTSVTSVGVSTDASWLTVGSSPITNSGTITVNKTTGQTANQFLATPNGTTGVVDLRTIVVADLPTSVKTGTIGTTFNGGGAVIQTGYQASITAPFGMTITNWQVVSIGTSGLLSGSIVVDLYRSGASIIGGGNKPTLSSASSGNAAVSGWTSVTVSAGDILLFNITSATTVTNVTLTITGTIS